MAVSLQQQTWTSTNYNWFDTASTSAPNQLDAKLKAWIASVNSNSSNTNKQITVLKDPSNASGVYCGWTLKFASTTTGGTEFANYTTSGSTFILGTFTNSSANRLTYVCREENYSESTSNGGYGTFSYTASKYYYDTSMSFYTSGQTAEILVATDTVDGKEFFLWGYRLANNNSYSDALLIFKQDNGEWAVVSSDGGSLGGTVWMPKGITTDNNSSGTAGRTFGSYGISSDGPYSAQGTVSEFHLNVANGNYFQEGGEISVRAKSLNTELFIFPYSPYFGYGKYYTDTNSKRYVCVHYGPFAVRV